MVLDTRHVESSGPLTGPHREEGRLKNMIAGVAIPDTLLAREATELVRDATDELSFNHCRRVYLWGSLLGRQLSVVVDHELFYVAAMFHDLGLTAEYGRGEHSDIDGANAAREFLLLNGFASVMEARNVWLAIAMQAAPGLSGHLEPEVALLSAGIDTDLRGRHLEVLTRQQIRQVTKANPGVTTERCAAVAPRFHLMPTLLIATFLVAALGASHSIPQVMPPRVLGIRRRLTWSRPSKRTATACNGTALHASHPSSWGSALHRPPAMEISLAVESVRST
jgi:hypothetical protein